ncbi:hypothetical protein M1146_03700, partial [Patescibacteria group bacterium]|nr:hypothetical protein [Patescibacteria group bacterium]
MPPKIHPIIGSRYNSLTIIGINPIAKQVKNRKLTFVECLCVCGKSVFYEFNSVKSGHSKSCGCSRNGKILISSEKQPLKSIWNNMISRCYNHRNISYKNYGYVGVEVCEEWRIDFYSFYNWAIENGWQKGLQLDKDIKGNGLLYSPDNCLFVTRK